MLLDCWVLEVGDVLRLCENILGHGVGRRETLLLHRKKEGTTWLEKGDAVLYVVTSKSGKKDAPWVFWDCKNSTFRKNWEHCIIMSCWMLKVIRVNLWRVTRGSTIEDKGIVVVAGGCGPSFDTGDCVFCESAQVQKKRKKEKKGEALNFVGMTKDLDTCSTGQ